MRILLADEQRNVRYAIKILLSRIPELELVGEVTNGHELLQELTATRADMIILDWQLPYFADSGSIEALRHRKPDVIIIALSGRPEIGDEAITKGANSFVSKIDPPQRLLATIMSYHKDVNPSLA